MSACPFTSGVQLLHGIAIAAPLAVPLVLAASLTLPPALLSWTGRRIGKGGRRRGPLLARRGPPLRAGNCSDRAPSSPVSLEFQMWEASQRRLLEAERLRWNFRGVGTLGTSVQGPGRVEQQQPRFLRVPGDCVNAVDPPTSSSRRGPSCSPESEQHNLRCSRETLCWPAERDPGSRQRLMATAKGSPKVGGVHRARGAVLTRPPLFNVSRSATCAECSTTRRPPPGSTGERSASPGTRCVTRSPRCSRPTSKFRRRRPPLDRARGCRSQRCLSVPVFTTTLQIA